MNLIKLKPLLVTLLLLIISSHGCLAGEPPGESTPKETAPEKSVPNELEPDEPDLDESEASSPSPVAIAAAINDFVEDFIAEQKKASADKNVKSVICEYVRKELNKLSSGGKVRLEQKGTTNHPILKAVTVKPFSLAELLSVGHDSNGQADQVLVTNVLLSCNPLDLTIVSQNFISNQPIIPGILEFHDLSLIVSLNSSMTPRIYSKGFWTIASAKNQIELDYNAYKNELKVSSRFNIPFRELASVFMPDLPLPLPKSVDIAGENLKLSGVIDSELNGLVIITAGTDPSKQAFLIVEKDEEGVTGAILVSIGNVKLSDMVKATVGQDISSIPLLGSLGIPDIALAISKGEISSDTIGKALDHGNLLHYYGSTIPSGVSGFVRFNFANVVFNMTYHKHVLAFNTSVGSLTIGDFLKLIPGLKIPSGLSKFLDVKIITFGYNLDTKNIFIKANFDSALSFLGGVMPIQDAVVILKIGVPSRHIIGEITGNLNIFEAHIPVNVIYYSDTHLFKINSDFIVPSLKISDMISKLGIPPVPLLSKFSTPNLPLKLTANLHGTSDGILIIEVTLGKNDHVFVILDKKNTILTRAVAIDIAKIKFSKLVKDLVRQDISSIPLFGSLVVPQIGFAISNGTISSKLIQNAFKTTTMLKYFKNKVDTGFTGFVQFAGATFRVTNDEKDFTFDVIMGSLSVGQLLDSIPDFKLPSGIKNMLGIKIVRFGFNHFSKEMFIRADFNKVLNLLNGVLLIHSPNLVLTVDTPTRQITGEINGNLTIANLDIPIDMKYQSKSHLFKLNSNFNLPSISLDNLIQGLGIPFPSLPSAVSISGQRVKIRAKLHGLSNGFAVIGISIGSSDQVLLVMNRENKATTTAIMADISGTKLSSLIKRLIGTDISSVPFIGSLALPEMGLAVSNGKLTSNLIGDSYNHSGLLHFFGNTIPSGFSSFVKFDFSKSVFDFGYTKKKISFNIKNGVSKLSVKTLISKIPNVALSNIDLPLGLSDILDVDIKNFGFDVDRNVIFIEIELSKTLKYFNGLLQISHPNVRINVQTKPRDIFIQANGALVLANTNFLVSIAKDHGVYYLSANADSISMSKIISSFSANVLPGPMQSLVSKIPFLNFGIKDFSMALPLKSKNSQIFLSGTPMIAGFSLIHLEATIIRKGGGTTLAERLNLSNVNLAEVIGKIAPFAEAILKKIPFLNQKLGTSIIIAPKGISDLKFSKNDVHPISVKDGITFQVDIPFPSGRACNKDPFCKVAKVILPPGIVLHVDTSIQSITNFRLVASISGALKLPGGIAITQAGVEIRVGEDTSIGIIGTVALKNPRLDFTSRIYAAATGVVMEMIMSGCWNNAFNLQLIDICNIHGSIAVGATIITEISLGGEIHFGVGRCSHAQPLKATGYVGLNTIEPKNNYYYADFPQGLSLTALFNSLCIKTKAIPKVIMNTGLEPGFKTSFTAGATGKSIPEINLYIPPGLRLNGTLNILGFKASANISADPSKGTFYASIALSKLNAGGLFQMYASKADKSRGPYLIADIQPKHVSVDASGYISVLGISVDGKLSFHMTTMSATVHGKILGIAEAELTVTASVSGSFKKAQFQCSGKFKNSFMKTISDGIKKASEGAAKAASNAIGSAEKVLQDRDKDFKAANAKLEDAKRAVEKAQKGFDDGANKVKSAKRKVDRVCHTRHCKSVCVCHKCIPDVTCVTANKACEALKATAKGVLDAASGAMKGLGKTLDVAKGTLTAAQKTTDVAKQGLKAATKSLDAVKGAMQGTVNIFNKIVSTGLNDVLNIQEIEFSASLGGAAGGGFALKIKARILGKSETLSINANLHNLVETIINPLVKKIGIKLP